MGGDPRDLDSLGLARAQPGRSAAETEVPPGSLSAGDTAGWALSWSSGSPPLSMLLPEGEEGSPE